MHGPAILYSEMIPPAPLEREFNQWYDEEHIPVRMRAPGFRSAQRYRVRDSRQYLAVYELDAPSALRTPEYQAIKRAPGEPTTRMLSSVSGFSRYVGSQTLDRPRDAGAPPPLDAPILYSVAFTVPADRLAEFDDWYISEHVPLLLASEDWLWCRRFDVTDGEPETWNRLALHYLADVRALESPERRRARETPWRRRLAAEAWFNGCYTVFERHGARQLGTHRRQE